MDGSMAPSPASPGVATPSPRSANPSPPTRSTPSPLTTAGGRGGSRRFMLALATLEYLGYKRSDLMYPIVSEIQFWYRRHSIRRYLERLTQRRLAATTLQCWKWHIWLDRWFAQQYLQRQKRLCLQSLCRGATAYAMSVRGDRRPPPTPTEKPSDREVLNHPFRSRGQPLPPARYTLSLM